MSNTKKMKASLQNILDLICSKYGYNPEMIFALSRERQLVEKRQIFFYLSKRFTYHTLSEIVFFVSMYRSQKINHATIIHSVKSINNLIQTDPNIKKQVDEFCDQISGYNEIVVRDLDLLSLCEKAA